MNGAEKSYLFMPAIDRTLGRWAASCDCMSSPGGALGAKRVIYMTSCLGNEISHELVRWLEVIAGMPNQGFLQLGNRDGTVYLAQS